MEPAKPISSSQAVAPIRSLAAREVTAFSVTAATITGRVALRAELACVRERGYSIADESLEVGLIAIAAPVYDHDGRVVAALSVAGPKLRLTVACVPRIGERVRAAAGQVSARLGYRP